MLKAHRTLREEAGMATTPKVINYAERSDKIKDCEGLGVPEVWVVSPEAQTVEVMDGGLRTTALLREGQLKPSHFPGVAVEISAIWPK